MKILFWGLLLLGLSFAIQLAVWRICLPKRQIKALLLIFFLTLAAGLSWLFIAGQTAGSPDYIPKAIPEYLHIAILFTSATLAYMLTYPALEADSPSVVMVKAIADAGEEGLDEELFAQMMNDDLLIKPRVRDLLLDKMARLEDGRYVLTPKGVLFARIFMVYRKIMNAGKGG
jgi:hypothetical protein